MVELSVGVRELKSHLSEYLRRLKAGETIIITERGRPIGRLIPEARLPEATVQEKMQRLIDAGLVEWNGQTPPIEEPTVRNDSGVLASDLIVEMRQ